MSYPTPGSGPDRLTPDAEGSVAVALFDAILDAGSYLDAATGPDDLAAILAHQLAAPLAIDLAPADIAWSPHPAMPGEPGSDPTSPTFADLLFHPAPPVELLERVKQFAKDNRLADRPAIPREVATTLYYASILAAHLSGATRISSLGSEELLAGGRWAAEQPWIDPVTRSFFQDAVRRLLESGAPGEP